MPKRRSDYNDEEKLRRKIRRYQKRLENLPNQEHDSMDDQNNICDVAPDTFREDEILVEYDAPPTPLYGDNPQSLSPRESPGTVEREPPVPPPPANPEPVLFTPPPCPDTATAPGPSDTPVLPLAPVVDPDLLCALGDRHADSPEWGENILEDISQRWEPILKSGLTKEIRESITKKYFFPKNMALTKPPLLNPEVSAVISETSRNRDVRVGNKQRLIGHALTAVAKVMTGLLTKTIDTPEVLRILNDAGKIIADCHYSETETRRSLIMPLLEKSFVTPIKDRRRDAYLFGDNLGEFIKSSQGIKKTGQIITPSVASTSGNLKTGPQRNQRHHRGMPSGRNNAPRPQQPYQGRRSQQYQRRPPPPSAARRNPPPPAPPGQPQSAPSRSRNANTN